MSTISARDKSNKNLVPGFKGDYSAEMREKISISVKKRWKEGGFSERKKGNKKGNASPFWKGDKITYSPLHRWVRQQLGCPNKCEKCGFEHESNRKIHWANKSREYRRELSDWIRLCVPCHRAYDNGKISL